MKNLIIFLFGAACGAGGTLLWLRKGIKRELEKMHETAQNDDDLPFTMGDETAKGNDEKRSRSDSGASEGHSEKPMAVNDENRTKYSKIVNAVKTGEQPVLQVPIPPREDIPEACYAESEGKNNDMDIQEAEHDRLGISEIEEEEFIHDDTFEKDRLVYFQDDRVMATENGTIITNPAMLVGNDWGQFVGHFADRTAFIRNNYLMTDYEIYVEDGTYEDEYGPYETMRED